MLREDLDAAIALPPREEWRPSGARSERRWQPQFILAVAAAVLLVVLVIVAGQLATRNDQQRLPPASPPASSPSSSAAYVEVTVTSSTTGLPIPGAVVNAYLDEPICCHYYARQRLETLPFGRLGLLPTDNNGKLSIVLGNGRYKLFVWVPLSVRPGDPPPNQTAYAPAWFGGADYQSARVVEMAGVDITGINVSLAPGHVISGRITNRDGGPIVNSVELFEGGQAACCVWVGGGAAGYEPGYRYRDFAQAKVTGEYQIAVGDGVYRLKIQILGANIPANAGGFQGPQDAIWWGGADNFAGARDIVVQGADVSGIDVTVPVDSSGR